jgi:hypothetical protein
MGFSGWLLGDDCARYPVILRLALGVVLVLGFGAGCALAWISTLL